MKKNWHRSCEPFVHPDPDKSDQALPLTSETIHLSPNHTAGSTHVHCAASSRHVRHIKKPSNAATVRLRLHSFHSITVAEDDGMIFQRACSTSAVPMND